jgi:hypothetical protein
LWACRELEIAEGKLAEKEKFERDRMIVQLHLQVLRV